MVSLFINPINVISNVGNIASKLNYFYNLSTEDIKNKLREHATPKNIAYATLATTAITGALIYPPTRIALCVVLSISYSMTLIALNLVIMGLYFAVAGTKGLTSIASFFTGTAKDFMAGLNEEGQAPNIQAKTTRSESLKTGQLLEKTPPSVKADPQPQSSKAEELLEKAANPVSTPPSLNEDDYDKAWTETMEESVKKAPTAPEQRTEVKQEHGPVKKETVLDPLMSNEDFDAAWDDEVKTSTTTPRQLTETEEWDALLKEQGSFEDIATNPVARSNDWVSEFTKTETASKLFPTADEFLKLQNSAPNIGQWVEEFTGDRMADEFIKQQQGKGGLAKPLMMGVGAAAVVFAGYKAYQAYQAYVKAEESESEQTGTSYANIPKGKLPVQETDDEISKALFDQALNTFM